jgi:hypothetical protein
MMRSVYDLEAREEIVFGLLGLRDRVLLKLLSIQVILLSIPCSDIPLAVGWALRAE